MERHDDVMMEKRRELYLRKLRMLRPIDDTFMRCLFRDDLPLAQFVLRIITGKADLVLTREETQKDLRQHRTVRQRIWRCLFRHPSDAFFLIYRQ